MLELDGEVNWGFGEVDACEWARSSHSDGNFVYFKKKKTSSLCHLSIRASELCWDSPYSIGRRIRSPGRTCSFTAAFE